MTETMELKPMPDEIYCRKTWPDGGNWAAVPFMGVTRYIRADLAQPSAPADVVEAQKIFDRFCRFIDGLYLNATFVENDFMTKHEQKIVRDALASLQPTNQPRKGRS